MAAISLWSTTSAAAILLLLLAAAPRHAAGGTEYTVGDAAGWTNGFNYLAWSQKYNFTVGDTLVFNYVVGQHDVYEVTEDAFRACEPAKKTLRVWVTGRDLRQPHPAGELLLHLQRRGPLPRRHEARRLRGRGSPAAAASAAFPAGVAISAASADGLCRRVVDTAPPRVVRSFGDSMPRCDLPIACCLKVTDY
ncbi:hypothetical protein EJB05_43731, partial [Eragrostis curvula]